MLEVLGVLSRVRSLVLASIEAAIALAASEDFCANPSQRVNALVVDSVVVQSIGQVRVVLSSSLVDELVAIEPLQCIAFGCALEGASLSRNSNLLNGCLLYTSPSPRDA